GPVGADALPDRIPVRPHPVVVRGRGRRLAGGLPGQRRAGDGPPVAPVRWAGVAAAPPGHPPEGPRPGAEAARPTGPAPPAAAGWRGARRRCSWTRWT